MTDERVAWWDAEVLPGWQAAVAHLLDALRAGDVVALVLVPLWRPNMPDEPESVDADSLRTLISPTVPALAAYDLQVPTLDAAIDALAAAKAETEALRAKQDA